MFGSFFPNLWSSCNQSVRSREPTLLCNQLPRCQNQPRGRTIASPLQTRRQSKTFRLGKTTLRVRAHVQAVGLNAQTKNRPALSRRGDFSLDISFYRTRRLTALMACPSSSHEALPSPTTSADKQSTSDGRSGNS